MLDLSFPKAVKIAVGIYRNRLFISKSKGHSGRFAYLETFALTSLVGLKIYPEDTMLLDHGMLDRTDHDLYGIALYGRHGNVLLMARLYDTRLQLSHFLTAADHGNTRIMNHADQIAAMLTNIEYEFTNCDFADGYEFLWDKLGTGDTVTFVNCTIGGVAITEASQVDGTAAVTVK